MDVVAPALELVGRAVQPLLEHLARDRHQVRMRDPGAVVALRDLALLVRADAVERLLVGLLVALAADGISAAIPPIACAPRR